MTLTPQQIHRQKLLPTFDHGEHECDGRRTEEQNELYQKSLCVSKSTDFLTNNGKNYTIRNEGAHVNKLQYKVI